MLLTLVRICGIVVDTGARISGIVDIGADLWYC